MKARLAAEDLLLGAVKQWARNLALGSFDLFATRGDEKPASVGRFKWDLTAPSYLSALTTWDAAKQSLRQGSLVFDVLLDRGSVDERAIRPFLYKCQTMRQFGKIRMLQFFLAEGFAPEALALLRKSGIVPARVEELFGIEVVRALRELIATLTQTAAHVVEPEKFDLMFSSLGRFEGAAGRLRGALFEFISAALLHEDGWHDIVINKLYREDGKDLAEVDVRARRGSELLFVECKGLLAGQVLDDCQVKTWLDERIPAVERRARANDESANSTLTFELWLTGELSSAAAAIIADRQAAVRRGKYRISVRHGPDLEALASSHKGRQPALLKVLKDHYLKGALSEVLLADSKPVKRRRKGVDPWEDPSLAPIAGSSALAPVAIADLPS